MMHPDSILRALEREFQENRARVWEDESIPLQEKQPEVDRLWREFDAQRTEIREGSYPAPREKPLEDRPALGSLIPRKRRPYWK
jgi:hypothetical protein